MTDISFRSRRRKRYVYVYFLFKDEVFDKVYAFIGKAVQTVGTETMHLFQVLLRIGYLCFALDE